jgi:hypothetical protein
MRFPEHQAGFFKLLSTLLYYLVSGFSNVGYLSGEEWNPFYKILYCIQVHQDLVRANPRKPRMYECIIIDEAGKIIRKSEDYETYVRIHQGNR